MANRSSQHASGVQAAQTESATGRNGCRSFDGLRGMVGSQALEPISFLVQRLAI
jgi:hypothetical protein